LQKKEFRYIISTISTQTKRRKMKTVTKQLISAVFILASLAFAADAQKVKKNKPQKVKTSSNVCPGANNLTETEINGILDAHNKARADVGLPKLKWNCKLADYAQQWAKRGIFEHRTSSLYGENIFASPDTNATPVSGVQLWMTEKSFWNNSTAVCQNGKTCTHYTQIVWKNTGEIGCGINRNASGSWKLIFVCNYSPAGNSPGKAY
jgi:uncharacterized protein YkwD